MKKNDTAITKYISIVFLIIILFLLLNFFYFGVITKQPVSPDYNVPVAKSILSGSFVNLHSNNPYLYSPGSSHTFLSLFLLLGFPNLFGLLSWIVLFIVCKKLADTFGLNQYMSIIFAASFCTTMSVIRTVGDQSIDKWLCTWFVLSLLLLERPRRTWKFSILIGFSLGMLIGTKFSGPLFIIALFLVYGKRFFYYVSKIRLLITFLIFTLTGLFWYIRNFVLKGNPYYPANFPYFKGYPHFTQQDNMLWKVFVFFPKGIPDLINSFLSEYMIWAFSGIIIISAFIYFYKKKQKIDGRIVRLSLLGLTTLFVALLLPITTPYKIPIFHIISDMRYIYINVIVLMLAVFILADKYKKNTQIATIALVNTLPVFSFVPYLPKIVIICILMFVVIYHKGQKIVEKIYRI